MNEAYLVSVFIPSSANEGINYHRAFLVYASNPTQSIVYTLNSVCPKNSEVQVSTIKIRTSGDLMFNLGELGINSLTVL